MACRNKPWRRLDWRARARGSKVLSRQTDVYRVASNCNLQPGNILRYVRRFGFYSRQSELDGTAVTAEVSGGNELSAIYFNN